MGATTSMRSPSASLVEGRAGAATKRPFTAVAILRPVKPSASRAAARVAASTSCASSLRKIRMVGLQLKHRLHGVGRALGQRGRQQEAVPKQAVGMQHAAALPEPRQVVGKRWAKIGAELDDLGLAEGWM